MPLGDFRSVFMPYCLRKQKDGRYVVLNREYKPVGFFTCTVLIIMILSRYLHVAAEVSYGQRSGIAI